MHWPELHALFTDWFFTQRLENFIKHWDRFEYQAKGSIHCHGVAKLKNDPGLCNLSEKALKGYLAEKSLKNADTADLPELNQQILDGKKPSNVVCKDRKSVV